jgi:glutathione-independent formaldehyde dehydrogenase
MEAAENGAGVYVNSGKVEVQGIAFPKMEDPNGRKIEHGVILRVVSINICGSDQPMVLSHEMTGEGLEVDSDIETIYIVDLVSVPFNVCCWHCRTCKNRHTPVCPSVNPCRADVAYGDVDSGVEQTGASIFHHPIFAERSNSHFNGSGKPR